VAVVVVAVVVVWIFASPARASVRGWFVVRGLWNVEYTCWRDGATISGFSVSISDPKFGVGKRPQIPTLNDASNS